jgi:hypothetical protein
MLASLADLIEVLGRDLDEAEAPKALRALRYASNLARSLAPWADWEPAPEPVSDAVAALAARRFNARNDSLIAVGPFRYGATASDFTSDERALILGTVSGGVSYTVSLANSDPA